MREYRYLVEQVLNHGYRKQSRNGMTISLCGAQLKFDARHIPLLIGRKIFYKGILGEFAAFMHGATNIDMFKAFECNYWDAWANERDGSLNLDYVNQLHETVTETGKSQLEILKYGLNHDPLSRRHMINLWRPENLKDLSLPCCHFNYQFIVVENRLNMIWTQRSADVMVGVPSDMILAYLWVQCLSKELGFEPGEVTMHFGDTHIYVDHVLGAYDYLKQDLEVRTRPIAFLNDKFTNIENFKPDHLDIVGYEPHKPIKFELKI